MTLYISGVIIVTIFAIISHAIAGKCSALSLLFSTCVALLWPIVAIVSFAATLHHNIARDTTYDEPL